LKSKKDGDILSSLIVPDRLEIKRDHVVVHNKLNRVLMAVGYPRKVTEGFLDKIIRSSGDFDFALHVQPYSIDQMIVNLNNLLKKLNADKYAAERKGVYTPSIDLLIRDTRRVLDQLQAGEEKIFNVGMYFNVKSPSKEGLDLETRQLESALNSLMIVAKQPSFNMREGLKSMMPLCKDELGAKRLLTTSALSACFPFTTTFYNADERGIMLAVNKQNNIPIIKDVFNFTNPNSLVLGTSGGGKSYLIKLNLLRHLMAGARVFVIDPQGEYLELCRAVGGQAVEISKGSESIINPLDCLGQDLDEKRLSLLVAFKAMFGDLNEIEAALLDKAVTRAYSKRGITNASDSWKLPPPKLSDLLEALHELSRTAGEGQKKTLNLLITKLEQYVSGVFSFLNKETRLDLDNDFVVFNIQKMPAQVRPLMMYLILEYIYATMQKDRARKVLTIDEAWSLMGQAGSAEYLFKIVKTCRKFNLSLMLITQEVKDLLGSKAGDSVLANTSCKYLMKQDPSVIDELVETMNLTPKERSTLLSAGLGEGILAADNERFHIQVVASDEEHKLVTTKADELGLS